ncbi:MAG: MutS family DNA mismatch repair protein [Chloroflexota bacterium]
MTHHITRLDHYLKRYNETGNRLTSWRLIVFFGGLGVVFFAFSAGNLAGGAAFLIWLVGFSVLVRQHQRVRVTISQFEAARHIHRQQIARMSLDWSTLPAAEAEAPPDHPYARDIDITGDYGVHRLLDTAVSHGGSTRLLDWLLEAPATPDVERVRQRQGLIQEIIPMRAFRERLHIAALLATNRLESRRWRGDQLVKWLRSHAGRQIVPAGMVLLLGVLAATNITLLVMANAGILPPIWIATFVIYLLLSGLQWSRLGGMFNEAMRLQDELSRLRAVLTHLERFPYRPGSPLAALCAPLTREQADHADDRPPSQQLRRIGIIVTAASLQRNPVVWIMLNLFVPWDVFFAHLLGRSQQSLARQMPQWLDTWYTVEASNALAEFAYLNPHYTFPSLTTQPTLRGVQLGHPLIRHEDRVCNDFMLDGTGQVVLVTGSNMSGKSSFLRTLGVNLTLAYAGSVVAADELEVGLFRLFSCIRVTDSVVDGISYFYAEVRRLRALLDALKADHPLPLFFLIDEIFRGTNNRERLIGSQSYITALAGDNGLGLIATHDLELVRLEETIPQITNYHFKEHVEDGRMVFDYRLRPGPSPTTNALRIMALEGLPVDEHPL